RDCRSRCVIRVRERHERIGIAAQNSVEPHHSVHGIQIRHRRHSCSPTGRSPTAPAVLVAYSFVARLRSCTIQFLLRILATNQAVHASEVISLNGSPAPALPTGLKIASTAGGYFGLYIS